ncbi:MotA/TolQ/ExbB proton channel family protein [Candidatus Methylocalor cossyra]|uniref:MotA/TolQ/ExbB proton channel family protein n=1 Tax=Candidatus Methylocalor cossyra TaxID=3108543 RepID=A0ABM9NL55_9GAMM
MTVTSANIVDITLLVLAVFSTVTWSIIFFKAWELWRIRRANRRYRARFRAAGWGLVGASFTGPLGRIAEAGFQTLAKEPGAAANAVLERVLQRRIDKERQGLEQGLSVLASIGSTAPFVGLFGTVWGIMRALKDIGVAKSASLDTVAGPIGEALIATAIGIATAIPAVLAYNFFLRAIRLTTAELEYFANDFLTLAVMHGGAIPPATLADPAGGQNRAEGFSPCADAQSLEH